MQILVTESKECYLRPRELFDKFKTADPWLFEDEHPQGRVISMFLALNDSDALMAEYLDRFCNIDMLVALLEDTSQAWTCTAHEVDLYEH